MLLEDAARLAGGHRWIESRLFEILGGWVASTNEVEAKLLFDRHSQHHAWRAAQWWDRLPVSSGLDRDAYVRPATPGLAAAADLLAGLTDTVTRLSGAYRVALPRLAAAYQHHRSEASPQSDGASIRTLDLLRPDVLGDWLEGEVTLQQILVDIGAVEAAAATVATVEGVLLGRRG